MPQSKRSASSRSRPSRQPPRPGLLALLAAQRRRRRIIAIAAVFALTVVVLIDRAGLLMYAGDERSQYDGRTFDVVQIVAGDTLELSDPDRNRPTTRVRLWGVTTPAPASPAYGRPTPEPFADEAIAFVGDQLVGRSVRLQIEPHRLRDEAGQLLAHVYPDRGLSLNAQLLRVGLASIDHRWSHEHLADYAAHEAEARAAGRGMWADASP